MGEYSFQVFFLNTFSQSPSPPTLQKEDYCYWLRLYYILLRSTKENAVYSLRRDYSAATEHVINLKNDTNNGCVGQWITRCPYTSKVSGLTSAR